MNNLGFLCGDKVWTSYDTGPYRVSCIYWDPKTQLVGLGCVDWNNPKRGGYFLNNIRLQDGRYFKQTRMYGRDEDDEVFVEHQTTMAVATKPKRAKVADLSFQEPVAATLNPAPGTLLAIFAPSPEEGQPKILENSELVIWPKNPRLFRRAADVEKIARSVGDEGQDDELKVKPERDAKGNLTGRYEIFDGGTRFDGRDLIGRKTWRCRVYDVDDKTALKMAARTQTARKTWGALDWANYYRQYRAVMPQGEATPLRDLQEELKKDVDIDPELKVTASRLHQFLNLLELPRGVQVRFAELDLTEAHGRELLKLQGHDRHQLAVLYWYALNTKTTAKGTKAPSAVATGAEVARQMEELGLAPKKATKAVKAENDAKKAEQEAAQGNLFGGEGVSTRVDNGAAPKGNPDDAELPKEAPWRPDGAAQYAGVNGVGETAPASEGSGFATAPEAGQTVQPAPGQFGTRSIVVGEGDENARFASEGVNVLNQLTIELKRVVGAIKKHPELTPNQSGDLARAGGALGAELNELYIQIEMLTGLSTGDGHFLWKAQSQLRAGAHALKQYQGKSSLGGGETYIFDFVESEAKNVAQEVKRIKPLLKELEEAKSKTA